GGLAAYGQARSLGMSGVVLHVWHLRGDSLTVSGRWAAPHEPGVRSDGVEDRQRPYFAVVGVTRKTRKRQPSCLRRWAISPYSGWQNGIKINPHHLRPDAHRAGRGSGCWLRLLNIG